MDLQFIGWGVAAALGLFMVYRHIMHKMNEMQRAMWDNIRMSDEARQHDIVYIRDRNTRLSERMDALEVACECKSAKDSKGYYNSGI